MKTYEDRGVSPHKPDVRAAVANIHTNVFPGAFCWITEDVLYNESGSCLISHADGAGTKSSLAYLQYMEGGDVGVFRGIAQDSLAMNINDILCVGCTGPFLVSNTIGRNLKRIPGEVISAIVDGYAEQCDVFSDYGIQLLMAGGETADLGDLVRTVIVDSTVTARMPRSRVIDISKVRPGLTIIGLASFGKAKYEAAVNSGIGTNGFSSLRHEVLHPFYREKYPESFAPEILEHAYVGGYMLSDKAPFSLRTIAEEVLSPTRIYAPVLKAIFAEVPGKIAGVINNSGGGQTKCLNFGQHIRYVKDNPIDPPPVFEFIRDVTRLTPYEMARTFNMGTLMEVICSAEVAEQVIQIAESFSIQAKAIGFTERSDLQAELVLNLWGRRMAWSSNKA